MGAKFSMPNKNIRRGPAAGGAPSDFINRPTANDIYVDGSTDIVTVGTGTSGTTAVALVNNSSAQTLTNKTLTAPVVGAATVTSLATANAVVKFQPVSGTKTW